MPTRLEDDLAVLYADALHRLTTLLHTPGTSHADRERVRDALVRLHRAYSTAGIKELSVRAAELNTLASALQGVAGHFSGQAIVTDIDSLRETADDARRLLVRAAREAFPNESGIAPKEDNPDEVAGGVPVSSNDRLGSSNNTTPPTPSRVSPDRREEYNELFTTCVTRPDKVANVNWYAEHLRENEKRYAGVGEPLGIPWWFIGAIHGLESGFAFDRHLHNGDPLTARTRRVPPNRPSEGGPPFTWEQSAVDALRYMGFDRWGDWSVPGALYQWEAYNGFGYRKYNIHSPYLWGFSNHYDKGRYVRDHVFDSDAVSNQCGAGTLLRSLVNAGTVTIG